MDILIICKTSSDMEPYLQSMLLASLLTAATLSLEYDVGEVLGLHKDCQSCLKSKV